MLRIGKLTDYATVILATLASDSARLMTAAKLSERTHIASPTVAKLLKQLHRAGLVDSVRGTHGGYQLAREPENISAAAILDALEGPIALTECAVGSGQCGIEHTCSVGRAWQRMSLAIRRSLSEVSLAQLAGLDNRAPSMPIERELKYMGRAKAVT
jgi:FeS assembly SUF system regulator